MHVQLQSWPGLIISESTTSMWWLKLHGTHRMPCLKPTWLSCGLALMCTLSTVLLGVSMSCWSWGIKCIISAAVLLCCWCCWSKWCDAGCSWLWNNQPRQMCTGGSWRILLLRWWRWACPFVVLQHTGSEAPGFKFLCGIKLKYYYRLKLLRDLEGHHSLLVRLFENKSSHRWHKSAEFM